MWSEATLIMPVVKPPPQPPRLSPLLPLLCRGGDETLISSIREKVPQMFAMRWLLAAADLCDHGNQPIAISIPSPLALHPPPHRLSVSSLCQNCCSCASPSPSIPPRLLIFKSVLRGADAMSSASCANNPADDDGSRPMVLCSSRFHICFTCRKFWVQAPPVEPLFWA